MKIMVSMDKQITQQKAVLDTAQVKLDQKLGRYQEYFHSLAANTESTVTLAPAPQATVEDTRPETVPNKVVGELSPGTMDPYNKGDVVLGAIA
ncbi:Uu.00g119840.m01.CDS01 [Anthostomella pinea]|uniref:Uu.00g119840.m01.CDS01 n=1 Tax=Anthostomella pinea TaxID=933095 RepID=A0AAI8YH26_9PEZI|nr:Uu.00g119840.m01.CDS01 [Anthostomella pinea]